MQLGLVGGQSSEAQQFAWTWIRLGFLISYPCAVGDGNHRGEQSLLDSLCFGGCSVQRNGVGLLLDVRGCQMQAGGKRCCWLGDFGERFPFK